MPEKFDMVLSADNPSYKDLPGVWILLGLGVWIGHFFYWGFNQYITQRALAAKDIKEAQKGVMFAAYLKLLMPVVIVLPGICAAILFPMLEKSDQAYPTMMSLLPNGLLGLTFAALIAAIVSSLASMSNSISTIFTMDIYKYFKNENVSQFNLIQVGRMTVIVSVLTATLVAQPLLGSFESIFQYIQNFTGYFSPGIVVIFLVALFWKKATSMSVLIAALISLIASILISINFPELPFIHRMTIVFILSALGCIVTTYIQGYKDQIKAIDLSAVNFSTSKAFNLNTIIIIFALVCIYVAFA
jgi:SSS family solute:Na+ symporter